MSTPNASRKARRRRKRRPGKSLRRSATSARILEDKEIDAVTIAMPNFWHAPASILGQQGKHVYVEKPGSYCAREAEMIVEAARKYDRKVQMGNQRRSQEALHEAVQQVREGVIGTLRSARTYYTNARGSIGKGKITKVPERLDYALWQGPAPTRPYKDNLVHYNWHWHWHWGNGELGNNGIHALDVARWALGVDVPLSASCHGGRYHFDDDQETPDTAVASFDFGDVFATWEGSSCHKRVPDKLPFVEIYGDGGCVKIDGRASYQIFDPSGKEVGGRSGTFSDVPHFANFADGSGGTELNSEIGDAQKSTLMCHLGNIAYRTGKVIKTPDGGASEKTEFWSRDYEDTWAVKV